MLNAKSPPSSLSGGEPARACQSVLVVEDDLNSREGLRWLLTSGGYRVETAADGLQAIKRVKDSGFDLAIIDLDLPAVQGVTVNGWDLVRICRAFSPSVSIIVVTAQSGEDVEALAVQLRVPALLEKPIDAARLWGALRRLGLETRK